MNAENIAKRKKKAKRQWHGECHQLKCVPKPCVWHPKPIIWTPRTDITWVQFPTRRDVLGNYFCPQNARLKHASTQSPGRNLQDTCRKTASEKIAKPARLSLIAIAKCYCSNKFDADLMRDGVFWRVWCQKKFKKPHESLHQTQIKEISVGCTKAPNKMIQCPCQHDRNITSSKLKYTWSARSSKSPTQITT